MYLYVPRDFITVNYIKKKKPTGSLEFLLSHGHKCDRQSFKIVFRLLKTHISTGIRCSRKHLQHNVQQMLTALKKKKMVRCGN